MRKTGWLGEDPGDDTPPLHVTEMLLARRERRAGPLETALARSAAEDAIQARREAAEAIDPDEHAANLVSRGYLPGLASQLAQRLGDAVAELEAEKEKVERGDPGRVSQLERRVESLRRQCGEAQQMITPPQAQRSADPVGGALERARDAHQEFVEVTRAQLAGQSRPRAWRPFAGRGSVVARSECCVHCIDQGVDDETSYLLHSDPELNVPVTAPGTQAEADRLMELGYSKETARYAYGLDDSPRQVISRSAL